jgi:uncharacterized protein
LYNQFSIAGGGDGGGTLGAKKVIKVLAIDGGGIRGVIPAAFCQHLETILGSTVPMWKLFDFIVGTSTGGAMTMLLTRPDPDHPGQAMFSATDCVNLYLKYGKQLFFAPPEYMANNTYHFSPEFPESSVVNTLQNFLPKPGCELKQALTEVAVTAYDLITRQPLMFTSFLAKKNPDANFYMRDVAQASSAFPGLFPAAEVADVGGNRNLLCIDGGMSGACPIVQSYAYAYMVAKHPHLLFPFAEPARVPIDSEFWLSPFEGPMPLIFADQDPDLQVIVVSLGTGHYLGRVPYDTARPWGLLQWGAVITDVMFDATTHTAEDEARILLGEKNYFRFQVNLPAMLSGVASVSNVGILNAIADKAISPGGDLYPEFQRLQKLLTS